MTQPLTIVGSFVSPYVRKVLACLNLKGLAYEVDPITPFFGNDEFERLSPLRRIPVLIDGDFSLSNFSVICCLSRRSLSRATLCSPPIRRTAPAPAGSRNSPTPASATCSSGACSIRRSCTRWCGASRAMRSGSRGRSRRGHSGRAGLSGARAPGVRLPVRRDRARRHCDRQLVPQRRLRRVRTRSRTAGRGPRRSSPACSSIRQSLRCCRSRTCSASVEIRRPPPGAARCRRAADRRHHGPARAARGHHAPLALKSRRGCREIQCSRRVLSDGFEGM